MLIHICTLDFHFVFLRRKYINLHLISHIAWLYWVQEIYANEVQNSDWQIKRKIRTEISESCRRGKLPNNRSIKTGMFSSLQWEFKKKHKDASFGLANNKTGLGTCSICKWGKNIFKWKWMTSRTNRNYCYKKRGMKLLYLNAQHRSFSKTKACTL